MRPNSVLVGTEVMGVFQHPNCDELDLIAFYQSTYPSALIVYNACDWEKFYEVQLGEHDDPEETRQLAFNAWMNFAKEYCDDDEYT